MDKYSRLREKFDKCEKIIGTISMGLTDPVAIDIMNREDLDFLLFDGEHGNFDTQNIAHHLQVCRLMGLPSFMRAPSTEYHLIAKAFDMGVDGIMLPRVETMEQIKTAINAMHFYPVGRKGYGGYFILREGEKYEDYSKTRFFLPQIESVEGIDLLPQMLEEYGEYISAVIIGPCDLSIMLGKPMELEDPEVLKHIQRVFDICKSYGKSCGIFCNTIERAELYRSMGANVLWCFYDMMCFKKGYDDLMDEVAKID